MKQCLPTKDYTSKELVKIAAIALIFLSSIGVVGTGFVFRQTFSDTKETEIINDKNRYQEIRFKLWVNQHQIKHFPSQIPAEASNVHLAYSPNFFQGSRFFQVRLKLSNEEIKKLLSQYKTIAKYTYKGGNTNDHANLPNGIPTTFFYTSDSQEDSFPTSYEILVLGANNQSNSDFQWNHGNSYGVAIDSSASEIVYWAEEW